MFEAGNEIMTRREFAESPMAKNGYQLNLTPGCFTATLRAKAEAHPGTLRVFLDFDDGRQILAPVYHFLDFLGFREIPNGSRVQVVYEERRSGVFPVKANLIP